MNNLNFYGNFNFVKIYFKFHLKNRKQKKRPKNTNPPYFLRYQIEVVKGYNMKSWREDIKTVLMQAGVEKQETCFLFVDTQIINEQ